MSQVLSHTMDYIRRVQNIVFTRLPLNDIGLVTTLVIMDLAMMVKQEAKAMLEFNIDAEVDRLTHKVIFDYIFMGLPSWENAFAEWLQSGVASKQPQQVDTIRAHTIDSKTRSSRGIPKMAFRKWCLRCPCFAYSPSCKCGGQARQLHSASCSSRWHA